MKEFLVLDKEYCIGCGEQLQPIHGTAKVQCCGSVGYYSKESPRPSDFPQPLKKNGFFVYFNSRKVQAIPKMKRPNIL